MSGLVNGLQNRLQQFESARHLSESWKFTTDFQFFYFTLHHSPFTTHPSPLTLHYSPFTMFADT